MEGFLTLQTKNFTNTHIYYIMNCRLTLAVLGLAAAAQAAAAPRAIADTKPEAADTARVIDIEEVVVAASPKENIKLREQSSAVTLFSRDMLESLGVGSVKNLTGYVPNIFIPDYGSRLTSAMYIRGVGSRINTPAVGLYVDNVPMTDKSSFDFFLLDADRIDVLNGPQATLYGQNAMGGLVRIYTADPMRRQGTTIKIGATGRTSGRRISAVTRQKLSDKLAFSLGGYYTGENGFFRNDSTGRKADGADEAGGRARIVYRPTERLSFDFHADYAYTNEDAYPYYYTGKAPSAKGEETYPQYLGKITSNRQSKYRRNMLTTALEAGYKFNGGLLSSVTSWQYLRDRMYMDQDFLAADIYSLEQRQRNNAITEEITYKTTGERRWQRTTGLFFMHRQLHTDSHVTFYSDGMSMLNATLARVMPTVSYENPYTHAPMPVKMSLAFTDPTMLFSGWYNTPVSNYAIFHRSTIHDLLLSGLSLTLGLRLDYEHQSLRYKMNTGAVNYAFATSMTQPAALVAASPAVQGDRKDDYVQLLPKVALQYDFANRLGNVYVSLAKGYRSGGYNIQMTSELAQAQLQSYMMGGVKTYCDGLFGQLIEKARTEQLRQMFTGIRDMVDQKIPTITVPGEKTLRYKPETSYNYEAGTHLNLLGRELQLDAALFYTTTRHLQIARFSASGLGRQMVNAGRSSSCGAELALRSSLLEGRLNLSATYGYTHSEFHNYNDGQASYKGNRVPFVPEHNMSIAAAYAIPLNAGILKGVAFGADVTGAGRIYWTESDDTWQNFYANLGAHVDADFGLAKLRLWGKNITDAKYDTFYFETMNRGFSQHGAPCHFGADLTLEF